MEKLDFARHSWPRYFWSAECSLQAIAPLARPPFPYIYRKFRLLYCTGNGISLIRSATKVFTENSRERSEMEGGGKNETRSNYCSSGREFNWAEVYEPPVTRIRIRLHLPPPPPSSFFCTPPLLLILYNFSSKKETFLHRCYAFEFDKLLRRCSTISGIVGCYSGGPDIENFVCRVGIMTFLRESFEVTRVLVTRIYLIRSKELYILRLLFPFSRGCVNASLAFTSRFIEAGLIEFRCYLRVELRRGVEEGFILNSSIDQGRNHVHCMVRGILSSSRKSGPQVSVQRVYMEHKGVVKCALRSDCSKFSWKREYNTKTHRIFYNVSLYS